jgi:hypothetical protein
MAGACAPAAPRNGSWDRSAAANISGARCRRAGRSARATRSRRRTARCGRRFRRRWVDLDHVAAHAECPAAEVGVVALVENLDQAARNVFAADLLAFFEQQKHAVVGLRRAQAVDATDRADDDRVAPLEERARGREAQLVELLVDGGFFFDEYRGRRRECRPRAGSSRSS